MTELKPQLYCTKKTEGPIFRPIENDNFIKPNGGIWTSTYTPNEKYPSAWYEWCAIVSPGKVEPPCYFYILYPKDTAKVYTINSREDLKKLYQNGFACTDTGIPFIKFLDFVKVAKVYDAIHLTEKGQVSTPFSSGSYSLDWDCECTLWFRDVFEEIKSINITEVLEDEVK